MAEPSEEFREMLRHIRAGDEATAKAAWKECCEYVGGLEADRARLDVFESFVSARRLRILPVSAVVSSPSTGRSMSKDADYIVAECERLSRDSYSASVSKPITHANWINVPMSDTTEVSDWSMLPEGVPHPALARIAALEAEKAELVARLAELERKVSELVCPECLTIISFENDRPRSYLALPSTGSES